MKVKLNGLFTSHDTKDVGVLQKIPDYKIGEDLSKLLDEKGIELRPFKILEEGKVGVFIYDKNNIPISSYEKDAYLPNCIVNEIFEEPKKIRYTSFKKFRKKLNKYIKFNYYLIELNSPATLEMGFICLKNDGNEWHTIGFRDFNRGYDELSEDEKNNMKDINLFSEISSTSFLRI